MGKTYIYVTDAVSDAVEKYAEEHAITKVEAAQEIFLEKKRKLNSESDGKTTY
jgi:hypothetical protein